MAAMVMLAGLASATDAAAMWGERMEAFAAQARTQDSNIFRISGSSDPAAVLGTSEKDDVYYTTSVGLRFDVPVSRQRFLGGIEWDRRRYERFSVLDFTNRHERALWKWRAGDDLDGELGHAQSRELASLANVQSGVQRSSPNALVTRRTHFNAAYLLTPRWRLQSEASRREQSNAVPVFQVNDITLDGVGIAASHVSPAGNQIGLGLKLGTGDLPVAQAVAGRQIDNSYRQHSAELLGEWVPTGKSRIQFRLGRVSRNYDQLPQRDFDGGTFHFRYDWQASGKLSVALVAERDISTEEQINVGFVLVNGVALQSTWRLTEKIDLSAALEHSDRDYLGDPGLVLGTVAPRADRVRAAAVSASWQPLRSLKVGVDWRRETRASTAIAGDYAVNSFTVNARLGF